MRKTYIQTSFIMGEVSRKFDGRLDMPQYYNACKTLENFICLPGGGIMRRPGSHHVGETKAANTASRLIPFIISANSSYVCDFGNAYARFWDQDHAQLTANNNTVELTTPYNEVDVYEIQRVQRIDTNNAPSMYLAHLSHPIQKVTHANNSFSIANHTTWLTDPNNYFNGSGNYPAAIAFGGGRLLVAGTTNQRQQYYGSRSTEPHNFNTATGANNTTVDADAFSFAIDSELNELIRWVVTKQEVIIGTMMGEWKANINMTPSDPYFYRQSSVGSAPLQAIVLGDRILFVSRDRKRVYEYYYQDASASWEPGDLTWYADHITGSGIIDWAIMQNPFRCLWCVTDDGELIGLTYDRKENVLGWHTHPMDGTVDSVAVIPTNSGPDEIWLVVKRTIDGTDKRFVEYFKIEEPSEQRDYFNVDCGVTEDQGDAETITEILLGNNATITLSNNTAFNNNQVIRIQDVSNWNNVNGQLFMLKNKNNATFSLYDYTGSNQVNTSNYSDNNANDGSADPVTNTMSGLSHLNNRACVVIADGAVHANKTPSNGSITLDRYVNTIHVGIGYNSVMETLRIETMETMMRQRRIVNVRLRFHNTVGAMIGPDSGNMTRILFRTGSDVMGEAAPLYSGDKEETFEGQWDHEGYVRVEQRQPLPCAILSMAADINVGDA